MGNKVKVTFVEETEKKKGGESREKKKGDLRNHEMVKKAQKILKAKIPEER